jgi:hypothetical protein
MFVAALLRVPFDAHLPNALTQGLGYALIFSPPVIRGADEVVVRQAFHTFRSFRRRQSNLYTFFTWQFLLWRPIHQRAASRNGLPRA